MKSFGVPRDVKVSADSETRKDTHVTFLTPFPHFIQLICNERAAEEESPRTKERYIKFSNATAVVLFNLPWCVIQKLAMSYSTACCHKRLLEHYSISVDIGPWYTQEICSWTLCGYCTVDNKILGDPQNASGHVQLCPEVFCSTERPVDGLWNASNRHFWYIFKLAVHVRSLLEVFWGAEAPHTTFVHIRRPWRGFL